MLCIIDRPLRWLTASLGGLLLVAWTAAPAWAQPPAVEGPPVRGYTIQYLMVVLLAAMAVSAVCKSSYRHEPEDE